MSKLPALMPLTEADYEAIEAAVVETNRGRWFLAEYARRNRNADTTLLLTAIERIEATIRGERGGEAVDRIRFDLIEMAKAIARTKAEIATIKPDSDHHGKFGEATEELDSIVHATEAATSEILAAAEQIQEIAWTLREQGLEAEVCDIIDARATDIYTACSFQDLTGQRSRKVIQVLRYLEGRINAMIDIWGLDSAMAAEAAQTAKSHDGGTALLSGPPRTGQGSDQPFRRTLDQSDVDVVMGPAVAPSSSAGRADHDGATAPRSAPVIDGTSHARHRARTPDRGPQPASAPRPAARPPVQPDPRAADEPTLAPAAAPAPAPASQAAPRARESAARPDARPQPAFAPRAADPRPRVETPSAKQPNDPLAPISALSAEEKIALFS